MWIAFKLYLWNIEISTSQHWQTATPVVNCFQIVSLKYWNQLFQMNLYLLFSCELLSNCIFEILKSATAYNALLSRGLWIAFKLYLWNIEISIMVIIHTLNVVVNCFQIVSLKYWNQRCNMTAMMATCCELLSNCIFEILKSAHPMAVHWTRQLWIAFKLYLWNIEISLPLMLIHRPWVVNCFQIVSLKYWNQQNTRSFEPFNGCELLSNCIFEILKSASRSHRFISVELWIAFKLYLWNIEISNVQIGNAGISVVNCFQIVSLKYWNQP